MQTHFDYAVYIGRFQPFHQGHLACVREGLQRAQHIIILVGSVNLPHSTKNPWSYQERRRMIRSCFTAEQNKHIHVAGLRDYNDDNLWDAVVIRTVQKISNSNNNIALIGFHRDQSSYYLTHFPQWKMIELEEYQDINATVIREQLLSTGDIRGVTRSVADRLRHFLKNDAFISQVNNSDVSNYADTGNGMVK